MSLAGPFPGHTELTTFADLRRDLEGLVVRNAAGVMRAGIFPDHLNPLVTGRSDMKLNVADFRGMQARGGAVLLANVGVDTSVILPAAPAANKRIDLIYATMRSTDLGDAESTPIFGFVQGTAAPSPTVPSLPPNLSDALVMATVEIPAGATTTLSSGVIITQLYRYTALAGGTVVVRNSVELAAWTPANGAKAFVVAENSEYVRRGGAWSADGDQTAPVTVWPTGWSATVGYTPFVLRTGNRREIFGACTRTATSGPIGTIVTVAPEDRPSSNVWLASTTDQTKTTGQLFVQPSGVIGVPSGYGDVGSGGVKPLAGAWYV